MVRRDPWSGAAFSHTPGQTALRTDPLHSQEPALQQSPQGSNSPGEDPHIPTKTALPSKIRLELSTSPRADIPLDSWVYWWILTPGHPDSFIWRTRLS